MWYENQDYHEGNDDRERCRLYKKDFRDSG